MPSHANDNIKNAIAALESGDIKKSELLEEVTTKGRWMCRAVSPFLALSNVLYAGMPSDQPQTDEDTALFKKVISLHPKFRKLLEAIIPDEDLMTGFITNLEFYANDARSQDINTARYAISEILPLDPHKEVINPPIVGSKKSIRGWNHNMTAAALCPVRLRGEFDRDPLRFRNKVLNGEIKIRAKDFPSFLYPNGTVYDPNNIDRGLFRGHVFLRMFRIIFTGKSSALDGKRVASGASQAEKNGMKKATGETIAYAAMQAHFALSDLERWTDVVHDTFDYQLFFDNCVQLFLDDPDDLWVIETIDFITNQTPSLSRKRKVKRQSLSSDSENEGNPTNLILQQRAARRLATASNGPSRASSPAGRYHSPSVPPPTPPRSSSPQLQIAPASTAANQPTAITNSSGHPAANPLVTQPENVSTSIRSTVVPNLSGPSSISNSLQGSSTSNQHPNVPRSMNNQLSISDPPPRATSPDMDPDSPSPHPIRVSTVTDKRPLRPLTIRFNNQGVSQPDGDNVVGDGDDENVAGPSKKQRVGTATRGRSRRGRGGR